MNGSKERVSFIIEYISAYEEKIKLANKNHLFDEAQLFELFAQEICKLWFEQDFSNLNSIKMNYPCVDLISQDGKIYVQVSTQRDIFSKIKSTLHSLADNNSPELSNISSPVFFVLSNETEESVKDLLGENQIGKYPFSVDINYISTQKIIQKAIDDIVFQSALYELLKRDVEGLYAISEKLLSAFDHSISVGLHNIDTQINHEYEIDRSDLLRKIKNEHGQFNFICGEAGSGKSVICKKLLSDERKVLFVRADVLLKITSIDEIWNLSISNAFRFLKDQKTVVYVDALEYIANSGDSSKDILQALIYEISKYSNVLFFASCRSCDVGAFLKLIGLYSIKQFSVAVISDKELKLISKKYKIIKDMSVSGKYEELLHSPFYINEIVSRGISLSEASDVNNFRNYIWKHCICLVDKAIEMKIPTNEVVNTINHIVIERSKRFSAGVSEEEIDAAILKLLRTNNVVTDRDNLIRLKYDIYEDICFEKLFDKEFAQCNGDYNAFFNSIERIGDGSYRRYQIWISNKLLAKENRDKFLHKLLFGKELSQKWHRNTIIGIVKSPFCMGFFDDYRNDIIEKGMVSEIVELTNCFGFEMRGFSYNETESLCWLQLSACGYGRSALLKLIFENELYANDSLDSESIIKLCYDYALWAPIHNQSDEYVCSMICNYLDECLIKCLNKDEHRITNKIQSLLVIIYAIPNNAKEWIVSFWEKMKTDYQSEDLSRARIAKDILSWTLENITVDLEKLLHKELFDIAETIWFINSALDKKQFEFYGYGLSDDHLWGIKGVGDDFRSSHHDKNKDVFFRGIFNWNFRSAFEWSLTIVNRVASEYHHNCPENVSTITLFRPETKTEISYIGSAEMWLAGRAESRIPVLIGDLIYWLKESIIQYLNYCKSDVALFRELTDYIKSQIIENSNNIIPFTIIETIGFEYSDIIPGYANLLASNLELISWDISWNVHNMTSPAKNILMEQLKMAFGLPDLEGRYPNEKLEFLNIQDYMARSQFSSEGMVRQQCFDVLDYLYTKIDTEDAHALLQVQKMDMRNAKYHIEDSFITVEPMLSEGPQKIVDDNDSNKYEQEIVSNLTNILKDGTNENLESILENIDYVKSLMTTEADLVKYENYYVMLLCLALKCQELSQSQRSLLVLDWTERLEGFITRKSSYIADLKLSFVLFNQADNSLDKDAKRKLKKLLLQCLILSPSDGQISCLNDHATSFLLTNTHLSRCFFNTIIKLAEDEWNHSIYNQRVLKSRKNRNKRYCFSAEHGIPSSDDIIRVRGLKPYTSNREDIITRYLYDEEELDIRSINIDKIDPGYLFISLNSGLRLADPDFSAFVRKAMPIFIQSMGPSKADSFMDTYYQRLSVKKMLERELSNENEGFKAAIDVMFDDVDFSQFSHDTINMYVDIFGRVDALYFDSFGKEEIRKNCRKCIEYAEEKIKRIVIPYVKNGLEKILILDSERMGDWNKCETHYSFRDKSFLCDLWNRYCIGHEVELLRVIYQMKIDELLPEVLPVVSRTVESLSKMEAFQEDECQIILKTIILKSLISHSEKIKREYEYRNSYETILNILISRGNESAAVILDEFMTH